MRAFLASLGLAAALTACDIISGPEDLCACSPATNGLAVLYGEVIDPDGHLVESSRISAHLVGDAPCGAVPATLQSPLINSTGGSGQFRYSLAWSAPTSKCWVLWAAAPAASGFSASDSVAVLLNYTPSLGDSTFVRLQLR